jgi:hypothetical protein
VLLGVLLFMLLALVFSQAEAIQDGLRGVR